MFLHHNRQFIVINLVYLPYGYNGQDCEHIGLLAMDRDLLTVYQIATAVLILAKITATEARDPAINHSDHGLDRWTAGTLTGVAKYHTIDCSIVPGPAR